MLIIDKTVLQDVLDKAIRAVDNKTIPILTHVLMQVDGDVLKVVASNLELQIEATTNLEESFDAWQFTVPARKLYNIVKCLPEDKVTFTKVDNQVLLKSRRSRFKFQTREVIDFPFIDDFILINQLTMDARLLGSKLKKTSYSRGNQDVRYFLNGVCMEIRNKVLTLVATDGHRLSLNKLDIECDKDHKLIVPSIGVDELIKSSSASTGNICLEMGVNHIRAKLENLVITSKLIDGKYPDYSAIIPKSSEFVIKANTSELRETLGRVAILSNEKFKGVRIGLENGLMTLVANNPSQEEAIEEIEVEYSDALFEIGLNIDYLIQSLTHTEQEEVNLFFTDSNTAVKLQGAEDVENMALIMTMKL